MTTEAPHTGAGYDYSGPPAALATAAKSGDLSAARAAADWYRERGQAAHPTNAAIPDDAEKAYHVDVYRGEMMIRQAEGRHLRELLSCLAPTFAAKKIRPQRATNTGVNLVLHSYGLLVAVPRGDRGPVWEITCPTDHIDEENTRRLLLDLLRRHFPRGSFEIHFENTAMSHAGDRGQHWLEVETYSDE